MKRSSTEIFSISGQIEEVAANILIEAKKANRIEVKDFPVSVDRVDEQGRPVKFAVIVPRKHQREFNELIADLYA